ncbi:MAG: Sensory transduction protein LytR [Acidobacteria bacterium ADurb.Bin340]|nr:MAG: Sensory transduction protein LytR [Acidobacteria bacterium ADurb.Bin340]
MSPAPAAAPWSALVVEDEARLREGLVDLLRQSGQPWRRLEGAEDAEAALAACARDVPDVAFLDIRLPGMSGLELAARLPKGVRIVFVTAYDAHAIAAFEAGAVDYLLKPVTPERLAKTLERLRERPAVDVEALLARLAPLPVPEPLQWISATVGRRTRLIPVDEVLCFQSDSKLTRVQCADGAHYIDQPLKELAARLDPRTFQQIHRSAIVNLRAVAWLERGDGEGGLIHLKGVAEPLTVSAPFWKALKLRFP